MSEGDWDAAMADLSVVSYVEHDGGVIESVHADGTRCFSKSGTSDAGFDGVIWFNPSGTVDLGWQHDLRSPDSKFDGIALLQTALFDIKDAQNAFVATDPPRTFRVKAGSDAEKFARALVEDVDNFPGLLDPEVLAWRVACRYKAEVLTLLKALADDEPTYFEELAKAMRRGQCDNDFLEKHSEVRQAICLASARLGRIPNAGEVAFEYANLRKGSQGPTKSDSDPGKMHRKLSELGFAWIPYIPRPRTKNPR